MQRVISNQMKSSQERQIDLINMEIDAIDLSIDAENRKMEAANRANELDQRRLNVRQHGLDLLSKKEATVNKVYDDRVNSLNKVRDANSALAQQQQDRIKAIGDYINYQGKTYSAQAFKELFPGMSAEADNIAHSVNAGFGIKFPKDATRGDVFIRVDSLPTRMHKFNGNKWIEVDKGLSDTYVYNDAYIDHLIESVAKGEYDPELLTESEKELISRKLKTDDTNN
jgi:hypothetical protein